MAVAVDKVLTHFESAAGGASISDVTDFAVAAGGWIGMWITWYNITGTPTLTPAGGGLTWSVVAINTTDGAYGMAFCKAQCPAGQASGVTLSCGGLQTCSESYMDAFSFTGVATSGEILGNGADSGLGQPYTGGTFTMTADGAIISAAITDAGNLAPNGHTAGGANCTPTSGWTEFGAPIGDWGSAKSGCSGGSEYRTDAANGVFYSPGGVFTTSGNFHGIGIFIKAGISAPPEPIPLDHPDYSHHPKPILRGSS